MQGIATSHCIELPANDGNLQSWIDALQQEGGVQALQDWIQKNCFSPIVALDFATLKRWPWSSNCFVDVTCLTAPVKGSRLYELQPVIRALQKSLENELTSFGQMCNSVYRYIGYDAPVKECQAVLHQFKSCLLASLAQCARHLLQNPLIESNHFNPLFIGMWQMSEEMKSVFDAAESFLSSRFGQDLDNLQVSLTQFNDRIQLCTVLAFLANGHYSVMKRYRFRCLFFSWIQVCIRFARKSQSKEMDPHLASLMVARNQISPTMRRLILEKMCPTMTVEERSKHLQDMDQLQSINELSIIYTATKSLASNLSVADRTTLVQHIYTNKVV